MRTSLLSNIPGVWLLPSAGVTPDPVVVALVVLVLLGALAALARVVLRSSQRRQARNVETAYKLTMAPRHSWVLSQDNTPDARSV